MEESRCGKSQVSMDHIPTSDTAEKSGQPCTKEKEFFLGLRVNEVGEAEKEEKKSSGVR